MGALEMFKTSFFALGVVVLACGCKSESAASKTSTPAPAAAAPAIPELSVTQLASALKDKRAIALDANGVETRQKYGVVPGATLLSDHRSYALTELPSDKAQPLVFYCGGTQCRASDAAAQRALSAGYANVSVMRDGIRGWVSAGQPTSTLPKS
jgi:rhodanese-related sulfurtransferase